MFWINSFLKTRAVCVVLFLFIIGGLSPITANAICKKDQAQVAECISSSEQALPNFDAKDDTYHVLPDEKALDKRKAAQNRMRPSDRTPLYIEPSLWQKLLKIFPETWQSTSEKTGVISGYQVAERRFSLGKSDNRHEITSLLKQRNGFTTLDPEYFDFPTKLNTITYKFGVGTKGEWLMVRPPYEHPTIFGGEDPKGLAFGQITFVREPLSGRVLIQSVDNFTGHYRCDPAILERIVKPFLDQLPAEIFAKDFYFIAWDRQSKAEKRIERPLRFQSGD